LVLILTTETFAEAPTTDERRNTVLTNATQEGLFTLSLTAMAEGLMEQRGNPEYEGLPFEDRLGLLVDREILLRENRRTARNLRSAKLKIHATLEDVDFRRPRGLDRTQILSLRDAHFVDHNQVILIVGPTGCGKTYLACALAHAAIRKGHSALYLRAPRMFDQLSIARADGRLARLMTSWGRAGVLVIDDFLLRKLHPDQAAEVLEVIEDRVGLRSTIVTSQLPIENWHESLGDPTIADAVLDRLLEKAHRIELHGDSLRRSAHESERPSAEAQERPQRVARK
jgi:DNA replication protein DnaC